MTNALTEYVKERRSLVENVKDAMGVGVGSNPVTVWLRESATGIKTCELENHAR